MKRHFTQIYGTLTLCKSSSLLLIYGKCINDITDSLSLMYVIVVTQDGLQDFKNILDLQEKKSDF